MPQAKAVTGTIPKKSTRISLWVPDALMEEIDRVNTALSAQSGVSITRANTARVALLVYARTAVTLLGSRRIWSLNDLENAFVERLQPEQNTAPADVQRLLRQITEMQQQLTTLLSSNAVPPAG